jgi:hypothetical protein
MHTSFAAAAVVVAGLGLAVAQQPVPTAPTAPAPSQARPLGTAPAAPAALPEQAFRVKGVLGTRVSVQGNASVGVIDDLVFDQDGQIEYALVLDQGKYVTVPWQAVKFAATAAQPGAVAPAATVPMAATIAITPEQYRVIPTFTATTYPSFFTPAYRTQVYQYYGLTPRDRRVLERRIR